VLPDDPVKAPAAELLAATRETHDHGARPLLNCGEQLRKPIAQRTTVRTIVQLRVKRAVLEEHGHAMRMTQSDLFDKLLIAAALINNGENVTHSSEHPPGQLNGA
jgi:hypothetical protein